METKTEFKIGDTVICQLYKHKPKGIIVKKAKKTCFSELKNWRVSLEGFKPDTIINEHWLKLVKG